MTTDKNLIRIGNLLRQAEGTDNPHEAEAFTEAAQRLATIAAIDLEVARAAAAQRDKAATPITRMIQIGDKGKRGLRTYVALFCAIARSNDVTVDIAHNSTYVIAYGYDTDIEVVELLYSSLVVQMVSACDLWLAEGTWRNQTVNRLVTTRDPWFGTTKQWVSKPLTKVTARLEFQTQFSQRIETRLHEARDAAISEADTASEAAGETSTALVLKDKAVAIHDFYTKNSKARGRWRGGNTTSYSSHARDAGDRAARTANLAGSDTSLPGARHGLTA
jgi:hypothetical protein